MHVCRAFPSDVKDHRAAKKNSGQVCEMETKILSEGMECPNCHFATLKREGSEIVCPVCGYGYRPCT
jgi:ribosomal protein L37AE/L43A